MTAQRPRWRAALAVTSVLLTATACGNAGGSKDAAAPVKIGLVASLSGVYQAVGQDMRDGFQLYLDLHHGQLGGRPVDLVVADEGAGPATAAPAATKLVKQNQVVALTGLVGGDSVAAVAPIATAAHVPLVGANARPTLKDVSHFWTSSYMSTDPGAAIAGYIHDTVKGPVYAIGPDYQGGYDELSGFTDAFTKAGGTLANPGGKTTFTPFPQTTDFLPYLAKIAASGAKAVYTFYAGSAAVAFVKQYAQSDARSIPLYAAGFLTEGGVLDAEGPAAQGINTVLNYSPDLDNAANRTFTTPPRSWTTPSPRSPARSPRRPSTPRSGGWARSTAPAGRGSSTARTPRCRSGTCAGSPPTAGRCPTPCCRP